MTENRYLHIHPKINEVWENVGEYEIWIQGFNKKLKVKILKIVSSDKVESYLGSLNLEIKGKGCSDFYRPFHHKSTKEEARDDAIRSFLTYFSDEAEIQKVEDW